MTCFVIGFLVVWCWPVRSADEIRIRDFIERSAEGSVTYVKWGPHAKAGQFHPLSMDGKPTKALEQPVYRVVYETREGVRDKIFAINPYGMSSSMNWGGDNWIAGNKLLFSKKLRP